MAEARVAAANLVHRGLGRVEFFDLSERRMAALRPLLDGLAEEGRESFSFHAPVTRGEAFPYSGVTCFYLSDDDALRELSFTLLEETMRAARRWGAAYVVSHLTFGPSDTKDPATASKLAEAACRRMAAMSRSYEMPLDLEFAAYSEAFHRADRFAEVVGEFPELGLCIDVGHAYLGALTRGRDHLDDIAALTGLARSLHLWNTTGPEFTRRNHHAALHPSQRPEDGWLDIERIVELVAQENSGLNVIFEYPVEKVTPEIQAGYDWVARLLERFQ
jgi:sugar phosphate isomerase/epimerase